MLGRKKREKDTRFTAEALPHMDTLYRGAVYLTKKEAEADDLVQDTFLKAYKNFDKFEEGTNCKAWLYRIMTNTFLNSKRRSNRIDSFVDGSSPGDYEAYTKDPGALSRMDPEASFLHRTLSPVVKEALASLPPDFRAAVVLSDLQEFSYKEVAEILGCPSGTVMSRIFRGRKMLKRKLVQHAVESELLVNSPDPLEENNTASIDAYRNRKYQEAGQGQ